MKGSNLLPLEKDEIVQAVLPKSDDNSGFLTMATKKGLIKKTSATEFDSIRKTGKIAISLGENDELPIMEGETVAAGTVEVAPGECVFFVL